MLTSVVPLGIDLPVDVAVRADGSEDDLALGKHRVIVDVVIVFASRVSALADLLLAAQGVGEIDKLRAHVDRVPEMLRGLHPVEAAVAEVVHLSAVVSAEKGGRGEGGRVVLELVHGREPHRGRGRRVQVDQMMVAVGQIVGELK